MKRMAPDYYGDFACLMGACRHSCCVGWEIDIDDEAMRRFENASGDFGRRLRESIDLENGCFRLDEGDRCPFLNGEGLCDLILELGEESLCQICADHPRYRNFFSDREELGLGLCCEAAGRLILGRSERAELRVLEDDGGAEIPDDDEAEILALREELLAVVQDRSYTMEERVARMLAACDMKPVPVDPPEWARFLLGLERLDEEWTHILNEMCPCIQEADVLQAEKWDTPFEQLLAYLLFRHLPGALEDGNLRGRIAYAAFIWHLIRMLLMQRARRQKEICLEDMVQLCRLYSSEIEYSDENIGAILDWLDDRMD